MKKGEKIRAEKPKQYQQGWTEFYKLKFLISEDTLIPRPETELLVDEVLSLAASLRVHEMAKQSHTTLTTHNPSPITIMDIGTGSGAIAVSVAKNIPEARTLATDISEKALEIAKKNAKFHKVEKRIFFEKRDLLTGMQKAPEVIVTNLPYIPTARLLHIDPMVTDWEPKIALDGGEDGFELYRTLFNQIKNMNLYPKYLIGEIDYTQADLVKSETKHRFPNANIEVKEDLAKMQRYFVIKF
jgi:release factor glutamine methyltransferase